MAWSNANFLSRSAGKLAYHKNNIEVDENKSLTSQRNNTTTMIAPFHQAFASTLALSLLATSLLPLPVLADLPLVAQDMEKQVVLTRSELYEANHPLKQHLDSASWKHAASNYHPLRRLEEGEAWGNIFFGCFIFCFDFCVAGDDANSYVTEQVGLFGLIWHFFLGDPLGSCGDDGVCRELCPALFAANADAATCVCLKNLCDPHPCADAETCLLSNGSCICDSPQIVVDGVCQVDPCVACRGAEACNEMDGSCTCESPNIYINGFCQSNPCENRDCDDGNSCTIDTCEPQFNGTCVHTPVACGDCECCNPLNGSCTVNSRCMARTVIEDSIDVADLRFFSSQTLDEVADAAVALAAGTVELQDDIFQVETGRNTFILAGTFTPSSASQSLSDTLIHIYGNEGLVSVSAVDTSTGAFSVALTNVPVGESPYLFLVTSGDHVTPNLRRHLKEHNSVGVIRVENINCPPEVSFTLWWDGPTSDIDLHVVEPSGNIVYYANPMSDIGHLDVDDTDGFGPENYFAADVDSGSRFVARVHAFSMNSDTHVKWTLVGSRGGVEVWTETGVLTTSDEMSNDFELNVPFGRRKLASCNLQTCTEPSSPFEWTSPTHVDFVWSTKLNIPDPLDMTICKALLALGYPGISDKIWVKLDWDRKFKDSVSGDCRFKRTDLIRPALELAVCGPGIGYEVGYESSLDMQGCPECIVPPAFDCPFDAIVPSQDSMFDIMDSFEGCFNRREKFHASRKAFYEIYFSDIPFIKKAIKGIEKGMDKIPFLGKRLLKIGGKVVAERELGLLFDVNLESGVKCSDSIGSPGFAVTTLSTQGSKVAWRVFEKDDDPAVQDPNEKTIKFVHVDNYRDGETRIDPLAGVEYCLRAYRGDDEDEFGPSHGSNTLEIVYFDGIKRTHILRVVVTAPELKVECFKVEEDLVEYPSCTQKNELAANLRCTTTSKGQVDALLFGYAGGKAVVEFQQEIGLTPFLSLTSPSLKDLDFSRVEYHISFSAVITVSARVKLGVWTFDGVIIKARCFAELKGQVDENTAELPDLEYNCDDIEYLQEIERQRRRQLSTYGGGGVRRLITEPNEEYPVDRIITNADLDILGLTIEDLVPNDQELTCIDVGYECGTFSDKFGDKDCGTCPDGFLCLDRDGGGGGLECVAQAALAFENSVSYNIIPENATSTSCPAE